MAERIWAGIATAFYLEGNAEPLPAWDVRAGMLVVETTYNHEEQELVVVLRPAVDS